MLTVVIPYRRDAARLERLLNLVAKWPVVVADDSDDGVSVDVITVRLGGGRGFARAANAGLTAVRTPLAVVLNDDALPRDDCLAQLQEAGDLHLPAGPILEGPCGVESAGISVARWGRVRQRVDVRGSSQVDAVSGACIRVPAGVRFDERYPHGFEDVELCRRLGGARIVRTARCWHQGGGSLDRRSAAAQAHGVTGQMLLFPAGWREPVIAALHVAQVVRERGPADRLAGVWRGWRAARAQRD